MTLSILICVISSLVLSLILASSPLFLGLWILFISLFIATFMAFFSSPWLAMFMFLIYVGGLLVMFAYFVALAPNQVLEGTNMFSMLSITLLSLTIILFQVPILFNTHLSNQKQLLITTLYLPENTPTLALLALALFFALIAVVKICSKSNAPLRPFH